MARRRPAAGFVIRPRLEGPGRVRSLVAMALLWLELASVPAIAAAAPTRPPVFDRSRVVWSRLAFRASKLGLTSTSEIELSAVSAADAAAALISPGERRGLPPRGRQSLLLVLRSRLFGRESFTRLWFEPEDAEALQRVEIETSRRKSRYKAYRFTSEGVYGLSRAAADGETGLSHDQWSDVSEAFTSYPGGRGGGLVVTEPSALLYIASAADVSAGDRLEIVAFSKRRLNRVEIEGVGTSRLAVDYLEQAADRERRVRGLVEVLEVSLRARPLSGSEPGDLRLLGLQGEVDLYLDRETRVPLQVSGRVKVFGRIDVKLRRLTRK